MNMHSFKNIHFRFLAGISALVLTLIMVAFVQYWLGHFFEIDINGDCDTNDTLASLSPTEEERQSQEVIEVSEILPNCGIAAECPPDTFPVHIYTGQDKDDRPRLCVLGKYVISGNMNAGGRGLNAAIIETRHMSIVSVQNFDLYSQNSSALETWLVERVRERDIIIAFTFDEASKELSKKAKASLYKLGSGKIQDLQFRSQWYMISQKGIKGFTALERLTFAKNDHWGEAIDERMCVPKRIPSVAITPDPYPRKNTLREKVCQELTQLQCTDFCESLGKHEQFSAALLTNRSLIGNAVYSSPIVVVGGGGGTDSPSSYSSLVLTLHSLVHQPGIHAPSVLVVHRHDHHNNYYSAIVNLFAFQAVPVLNATQSMDYIRKGVETAKERFPNKKYVIIIEEGVLVSPDFLHYMAQMVAVLEKDPKVLAISAWNPNGYVNVSSNAYVAYRGEEPPRYAFLVPFHAFNSSKIFRSCPKQCHQPEEQQGSNSSSATDAVDIVYPEVSRALKRPLDIFLSGKQYSHLVDIPRNTNIDPGVWIDNPESMVFDRYVQRVESILNQSREMFISDQEITTCPSSLSFEYISNMFVNDTRNVTAVVIYYKEKKTAKYVVLKALASCFGLRFPDDETPPPGIYRGMLRFTFNDRHLMLIESTSYFYKHKIVENKFV